MNLTRILSLATAGGVEPEREANLRWFRIFLLTHVAARSLLTLGINADLSEAHAFVLWGQIVVCVLGLVPWNRMRMARVATLMLALQVVFTFPLTANHIYLEFILMGLLALLDEGLEGERALLLQGLRWYFVTFLFYTGFQKLLYGRYFDAQFFGHVIASQDQFAGFFKHFLPTAELERLRQFNSGAPGTGPFAVRAPLFVAMSNFVYVFEMVMPVLLMIRRTRVFAALATILFVFAIEAGAHEFVFGSLTINLLLLFLPSSWNRWLYPLFLGLYLYLIGMQFDGIISPDWHFFHAV